MNLTIPIILCFIFMPLCSALLEGLYCGTNNCYDLLGVERDAAKQDIARAYRQLARKYHPDTQRTTEEKKLAEEKFKIIATAYEILKDDESRTDYDYMLDNPEEFYGHYYRYYKRRVTPKVDVRIVIIVTITIISILQYYSAWVRYESAIKYFANVPKYRNRAIEMAQEEIEQTITRKGRNKMSKIERKEQLENIIRKVVAEKMDIKGAYAKPSFKDILWIQMILLPYMILFHIIWLMKWTWKFSIMKQTYGEEEKLYLIRCNLGMGEHQFNSIEKDKIVEYLNLELWKKDTFMEWKQEQEEEMRVQLAENPKYRQYRRYMKNHGPGRLTFED